MNYNKVSLSGRITDVCDDHILFTQTLAGKNTEVETTFYLHLPPCIREKVAEAGFHAGDEILVMDAQIYAKGEAYRIRITESEQLVKLSGTTPAEQLYLGEISAKEQFI